MIASLAEMLAQGVNALEQKYTVQATNVARQALVDAFTKHPERVNNLSITFSLQVDARGRPHNVKVASKMQNPWAIDTARRALAAAKYPPIPKQIVQTGADMVNLKGDFSANARDAAPAPVYDWQLSQKEALSIANRALAANHIDPWRYRWHQQLWRIIDTHEWFIQFSARYPGPGGNDVLVVLDDQSRKTKVRVLGIRWNDRVETVVPQYRY